MLKNENVNVKSPWNNQSNRDRVVEKCRFCACENMSRKRFLLTNLRTVNYSNKTIDTAHHYCQ